MRTPTDDRQGATVVIRMIAKDLRINPLRTSLTALSMFIGIIASSPAFSSARSDATIWKRQRATGRQVTHL